MKNTRTLSYLMSKKIEKNDLTDVSAALTTWNATFETTYHSPTSSDGSQDVGIDVG